ncbi:nitrogen fixation protein FixH [Methylibium rhizosphaerae]|jgi:hypothetical protein|uniref:nitrogen fixation protein FixH n=1 Tax=Methylibium rhizosphaerae TaxID=2570323 RepID=UPI00112C61A4|nr:nitrogen fixation protein FixH [Methylibium rhizosphaerae]
MQAEQGDPKPVLPWWRVGMVWLVIAGPLAVVLAGVLTAALAVAGADPVVRAAPDVNLTPAVQARNHAAAPKR